MTEFITISKSDEQFWPMLSGQFSKTHFAQPVRNLYVNSVDEMITFKIIEKDSLSLVGALAQWYSLARNIYLLFPIIGGVAFICSLHGMPNFSILISSVLSLQFFLMALTLHNDYSDYVNGVDRVNEYSSQKPLIQGLIRAYQAKQLAILFLGLSFLLAIYCFIYQPLSLAFATIALLVGMTLTSRYVSRRFKGISIIATFILGGPLLVLGYEILLFNTMSFSSALLGFVFGFHALKYDFCKQVRDIFYNSKAKVQTISTFFGFEKSKILYVILSIAHVGILTALALQLRNKELFLLVVVAICFNAYLVNLFYRAQSFLSSNISECLSLQKLHYTMECSLMVLIFLSPLWLSFL